MKLTKEQLEELEMLAGLRFDGEERLEMEEELSRILTCLGHLDSVERGAETVLTIENALRTDEREPSLPRELLLSQSCGTDGESFLVPRIVG